MTSPTAPRALSTKVASLEPWRRGAFPRLAELWRFRNYVPYFGKILIRRRYIGTWLGYFWILRPIIDVSSRALLFGGFLQVSSGDRPYFIFLLFGTSAWLLFERTIFWATRSIQMNKTLHVRLHVPRLPTVVSSAAPALLDFILMMVFGAASLGYLWATKGTLYLSPFAQLPVAGLGIVLLIAFGIAFGLFTAPLAVLARDIRFTLAYVLQVWYFLTPVVYPISSIPPKYRIIAELNPITAPVEMVKYGLLDTAPPSSTSIMVSLGTLFVVGWLGLRVFSRFEGTAIARM